MGDRLESREAKTIRHKTRRWGLVLGARTAGLWKRFYGKQAGWSAGNNGVLGQIF